MQLGTYFHIEKHKKRHTSTNKIPAGTIAEVMKDFVPMILQHLCMDIEAGIANLSDFLCKQFHSVHRVAKNN